MSTPARRFVRLVAAASLALALGLGATPALAADEVSVPDSRLRTCIERNLGLEPGSSLAPSQLAGITILNCTYSDLGATLHYQWQKNMKNIKGATAATYTLRPGDVRDHIRVRVKGTQPGCRSTTRYSKSVTPARGALSATAPAITGEPTVGTTLVADPGSWSPAPVHLGYRWYRDGRAIAKATRPQYRLRDADLGHTLTVRVTGSKSGYRTTSRASAPTVPVAAVP